MNTKMNQCIMQGIAQGDTAIIESFYRHNLCYVRNYILQNGGVTADVEDIFQEALVLLYHKLQRETLVIDVSIHTYFIAICKNKWRNQLRKQRKLYYTALPIENPDTTTTLFTETKELQEEQQRLYQKHVMTLGEDQKNVLHLFLEGNSMKEIAKIIGYSEGYARKKKYEIKEYLRQLIQQDPMYKECISI